MTIISTGTSTPESAAAWRAALAEDGAALALAAIATRSATRSATRY